jgi:hypothetical protein
LVRGGVEADFRTSDRHAECEPRSEWIERQEQKEEMNAFI